MNGKLLGRGAALLFTIIMLSGCWDKAELPELGYVMGVALDKSDANKIKMTSQIYKPAQTVGSGGDKSGDPYIVIESQDKDVFQAAREIPIQLGRKAQFSHMRVIIISEQIAKERNIGEVLDFFYRDHEPRLTATLVIAKGTAANYLKQKPLIEYTISQQIKQIANYSEKYSAKTTETSLLELAIHLRQKQGVAIVPYLKIDNIKKLHTDGAVVLVNGQMKERIKEDQLKDLLMLRNEYTKGVIDLACRENLSESFEVSELHTKRKMTVDDNNRLHVQIIVHILGSMGETSCSTLLTVEDQKKYESRIFETLQTEFGALIKQLQTKKLDALALGTELSQVHPLLWNKVKDHWEELFAKAEFTYNMKITIQSTGTEAGKPLIQGTD